MSCRMTTGLMYQYCVFYPSLGLWSPSPFRWGGVLGGGVGDPRSDQPQQFRVHEYRWYWAGNVLVHITFLLQAVAMGWQMLEITGSAFQVGLVAFMYGLPLLIMSPFSGLVADRMKRQWVIQVALCAAVLASALLARSAANGSAGAPQILMTSLILGTTFAFYAPARMALLPNLVPDKMIFNATTLSYSGTRLMGFFGPMLAGYLLDFSDFAFTLAVQPCYSLSVPASISRRHISCRCPYAGQKTGAAYWVITARSFVLCGRSARLSL